MRFRDAFGFDWHEVRRAHHGDVGHTVDIGEDISLTPGEARRFAAEVRRAAGTGLVSAPVRQDAERWTTLAIFAYEVLALLPGSPLTPITRVVSDHPVRTALVTGALVYHFHRHRQV